MQNQDSNALLHFVPETFSQSVNDKLCCSCFLHNIFILDNYYVVASLHQRVRDEEWMDKKVKEGGQGEEQIQMSAGRKTAMAAREAPEEE